MTVATANIYWYGLLPSVAQAKNLNIGFFHSNSDDVRLASMIASLGADLCCFEEIVDVERFERVVAKANPTLVMRDPGGRVVSSHPVATTPDTRQRVVLAWNENLLSLLNWQLLPIWTRSPIVAAFEHRPSGRRFHVIGTHAKSSAPEADDEAGQTKRRELARLAQWVTDETAAGRLDEALILGDLNSTSGGEDATHLQRDQLAAWQWREATGEADSHWTTTTDHVVIDHFLVSPPLAQRIRRWPEIVYFDRNPLVPDVAAGHPSPAGMLKGLTDHRPVRMTIDPSG